MTQVRRFWPLLTGTYSYEKTVSTRNRGHGVTIEAPILAYLIETANGRILYDVGCDYRKLDDLALLEALRSNAFYVGAIGSRANQAKRRERLALHFDMTPEELDRLHGDKGAAVLRRRLSCIFASAALHGCVPAYL